MHSLAAGLLLNLSQVHFFQDIGYRHMDRLTCPIGEEIESKKYKLDCSCDLRNYKDSSRWAYRDDWKEWIIKYLIRVHKVQKIL